MQRRKVHTVERTEISTAIMEHRGYLGDGKRSWNCTQFHSKHTAKGKDVGVLPWHLTAPHCSQQSRYGNRVHQQMNGQKQKRAPWLISESLRAKQWFPKAQKDGEAWAVGRRARGSGAICTVWGQLQTIGCISNRERTWKVFTAEIMYVYRQMSLTGFKHYISIYESITWHHVYVF